MRIPHALAIAALVATGATSATAQSPRHGATRTRTIEMHTGRIDRTNASRFADLLERNLNRTIGLRMSIAPNAEGDKYSVSRDERGWTIVGDDSFEALFKGGQGRRGRDETVQGLYHVRSGGMHQGIVSYALEPVEDATRGRDPKDVVIPRVFR